MSHNTMGLTAHGTWKFKTPMSEGIHHAMNPDPYKGLFGGKHCRDSPVQALRDCSCQPGACMAAGAYMEQFEEVVKYSLPKGIFILSSYLLCKMSRTVRYFRLLIFNI